MCPNFLNNSNSAEKLGALFSLEDLNLLNDMDQLGIIRINESDGNIKSRFSFDAEDLGELIREDYERSEKRAPSNDAKSYLERSLREDGLDNGFRSGSRPMKLLVIEDFLSIRMIELKMFFASDQSIAIAINFPISNQ